MVNLWSLKDLKAESDDVIPTCLEKLGYKQDHTHLDTRLFFGFTGVLAAVLSGLYDYRYGFEAGKLYTAIGVVVYFLAYGAMLGYQYFVEDGVVYVGRKAGQTISIRTKTETKKPVYQVVIQVAGQAGKLERQELFTKWFDTDGNIVKEPFITWLGLVVQEAEGKKKQ
ncbi:signal peptidase complex subunit 2 [Protomyces lactucae-debilis]|uniref:Signal peptidase complex subunit 2 n=1 Tax=Protomyces lactucae-debilis TaxID=2754530 RepID=A0A1Y2FAM4_PROLT|nr:signal peptidase complex subunit 2 [Protomyces lactucae-debilis]ORY80943.1 signal peptidase complex subunit 2 [Protomyces lactucae-debilis]